VRAREDADDRAPARFLLPVWFAIAVPAFVLAFLREWPLPTGWTLILWHAHELLFAGLSAVLGMAVAARARSRLLLGLVFLLGRAAIATSAWIGLPAAAVADLAYPALLLGLALRAQRRDRWLVAALAVLLAADALFHVEAASGRLGFGFRIGLALALAVLAVVYRRAGAVARAAAPPVVPPLVGLVAAALVAALAWLGGRLLGVLPGWIAGPPSLHRGAAGLVAIGWAIGRRVAAIGAWTGEPIALAVAVGWAILLLGRIAPGRRGARLADALAGVALAAWIAAPDAETAAVLLLVAAAAQVVWLLPARGPGLAGQLGGAAVPAGLGFLGAATLWPVAVTPSTGLHALAAALALAAAATLDGRALALVLLLLAVAARIAAPFSPHYTGLVKVAALFWLAGWVWLASRRLRSVLMRPRSTRARVNPMA
jgi:uncharacterized protein involved in response to NO